jgi:hypothetical protein
VRLQLEIAVFGHGTAMRGHAVEEFRAPANR